MTQRASRVLCWEACFNVRDVGGYEIPSGGRTRWRSFVRADNLVRLTPAGRASLVAYGVRTVIDLRAPFERRIDPSPFAPAGAGAGEVAYLHRPLLDREGADANVAAAVDAAPSVDAMYSLILERCRTQIGAAIRAVAVAPEGGVLVCCHAGKDRTGLIVALVLAVVGVPHATIAKDYALSERCLQPLYEAQLQREGDAEKRATLERQLRSPLNEAHARTMLTLLARLDEHHGGASAYLRDAGVGSSELGRLRARLGPQEGLGSKLTPLTSPTRATLSLRPVVG